MSYVYDTDGSVPNGKTDGHSLVGAAGQNVTAAEWNAVMGDVQDLRTAILTALPTAAFAAQLAAWPTESSHSTQPVNITDGLDCRTAITLSDGVSMAPPSAATLLLTPSGSPNATVGAPAFTGGTDGQLILVMNDPASSANCILVDEGTLPGSGLRLTATSLTLTPGSSCFLKYNGSLDKWFEVCHSILV